MERGRFFFFSSLSFFEQSIIDSTCDQVNACMTYYGKEGMRAILLAYLHTSTSYSTREMVRLVRLARLASTTREGEGGKGQ